MLKSKYIEDSNIGNQEPERKMNTESAELQHPDPDHRRSTSIVGVSLQSPATYPESPGDPISSIFPILDHFGIQNIISPFVQGNRSSDLLL